MTTDFAISWDYLCPFARNAHEHVLAGLEAGADWNVEFLPFSLGQVHVPEGEDTVFDRDDGQEYLYALAAGVTVRDEFSASFPAFHRAMFAARHDHGRDIKDPAVVREVVQEQGLDADAVIAAHDAAIEKIRASHNRAVEEFGMFGVPTFVVGDRAVFVRLMDRPGDDATRGLSTIEAVLRVLDRMPTLNEYKFTRIPR